MKSLTNRAQALFLGTLFVVFSALQPHGDAQVIKNIVVEGNKYVKTDAIIKRLPFRQGDTLDESKSSTAIRNLYDLGQFSQIRLEKDCEEGPTTLFVVVEEKKLLENVVFAGNKALKTREIKEKLRLEKVATADDETLHRIATEIKKLYQEENKHHVSIATKLEANKDNPDKVTAHFTITEGHKSFIKYVNFVGNDHMPARKLRGGIFTREEWLFGFMDSSGTYNKDMLEADKHRLEYFYRDHGYLQAKVFKTKVDFSHNTRTISVTFHIKEGPQFFVRAVNMQGDELHTSDELMACNLLEEGKPFSQSKMTQTMNRIKDLYGDSGYIYADVYPQVTPDEDTNQVDVTFMVDRGNKLYANRIIITGNNVTKDKVVRRQLEIAEGELITSKKLAQSQSAVEYLSFFERDGVQWRIHRLSDNLADLEMNLKEAKTGNLNATLNYGTDQYNSKASLRGGIVFEKGNLFGRGWDVGAMIQSDRHHVRKMEAHFFDPHLFDSDISAGIFVYKRNDDYEQWRSVDKTPNQRVTGGTLRFGILLPELAKRLQLVAELGIEDIKNNHPVANDAVFEPIVRRSFQTGTLKWFGLDLVKDVRNHQVYPTEGYKTTISTRAAPSGINHQFSYFKWELEGSYYRALIGDDSLVLGLHARTGRITSWNGKHPVPYKELFHMGGQSTVRGFTWGGIGPAWLTGDPLGARNALQLNTELIFPLIPDYSMKAHVFYDAGAGWDTPKDDLVDRRFIRRDKFDLRHSVGFGLNLLKPVPAKIDWGFKLDRKKHENESPSEFHLSMNYAW